MSKQKPEKGDKVFIIGKIEYVTSFHGTKRQLARIRTASDNTDDSFLIYLDQITLIEPDEITEEAP